MAQNFLYMFEFVVDDLLVTRPNKCAPEEYPTCCEISFRSSVFVAICDREYGYCVDTCAPKCGKCCLFSLESPVTDKDRLLIHVYKKKDNNCKFLLGAADMPIKPLFDKVTNNFDIENPQWMETVTHHNACLPDPKVAIRRGTAPPSRDSCYDDIEGRKEQFCPTSEMSKNLLPLFSMKGAQTGNLVLITRLVCNGPAIVSSFPFSKFCQAGCGDCDGKKKKGRKSCSPKPCVSCDNLNPPTCEPCQMPNPCKKPKEEDAFVCRRYFACNDDDACSCNECIDYSEWDCGIGSKPSRPKRQAKSRYSSSPCSKNGGSSDYGPCPTTSPCEWVSGQGSKPKPKCKPKKSCCSSPRQRKMSSPDRGLCQMPDPCIKPDDKPTPCLRYFACNADRGCPCDECQDECDRNCGVGCKTKKPKKKSRSTCCPAPRQTGGESCCPAKKKPQICIATDDNRCIYCNDCCVGECCCETECPCDDDGSCSSDSCCNQPCYMEPTRPEPGPDAFEEFEACLNGSGLTIRVLKDTHRMESVYDGTEGNLDDSDSECCDRPANSCGNAMNNCETLEEILNYSSFAKNALRKRTAGRIVNDPRIPKVRANIKYAGADTGCMENYKLPFSKLKNCCKGMNKLDEYRKRMCECDCGPIVPPKQLDDTRSCCLQVDPVEIKNMLKGVNVDSRKKGIEVCYKTCDDTDSDVFLVKLGTKKACERKQHSVEIELKTPKIPIPCPIQKCTTETQIKEAELDAALSGVCKKGKKKGKKGKKGKK